MTDSLGPDQKEVPLPVPVEAAGREIRGACLKCGGEDGAGTASHLKLLAQEEVLEEEAPVSLVS